MSYSRYCRYRAQLQRKCEINFGDTAVGDKEKTAVATNRVIDSMNMTRVLFCRDTYDYPAELLLQPFNPQQAHQQNTAVLVNHMGMYITVYLLLLNKLKILIILNKLSMYAKNLF